MQAAQATLKAVVRDCASDVLSVVLRFADMECEDVDLVDSAYFNFFDYFEEDPHPQTLDGFLDYVVCNMDFDECIDRDWVKVTWTTGVNKY
ncbi:hypothetical protein FOA52_007801 [Chlamydomonas sp. UWO 241]|nr:hypothetical protein FOA52_007801 [Chlamydomonas sp. UWO 241]